MAVQDEPLQAQVRLLGQPTSESGVNGLDVCAAAGGPVIVRIRQACQNPAQRTRPPFEIRAGGPDGEVIALAGGVGPIGAFDVFAPDRAPIGTIRLSHGRWELQQAQAPALVGVGRGLTGALRRLDANVVSGLGLTIVLPYRVEFSAAGRSAFVVRRAAGPRSRFTVAIQLPWVDRRLVLAQLLALRRFV